MAKGKGNKKDALEKALDRAVQDASEEKAHEEEAARFAEEVRDDDLDLENVEIHKDMDSADVTAVDGDGARPAPSRLRGGRQFDRRGFSRFLRSDRRDDRGR